MHRPSFLAIFVFASGTMFSQEFSKISKIDSLVNGIETKVFTSYQETGKNKTWASHSKNLEKISSIYNFTEGNVLVSFTTLIHSIKDTELVINLYFDSTRLIKATSIYFSFENNRDVAAYYFENDQLINKEMELEGMHPASYYLTLANRIRKTLKKKPIRFPTIF